MDPKYIDKVWQRARFESHQLGLGDVVTRFAINIREDVRREALEEVHKAVLHLGPLDTADAVIRELKRMKP